MTTINLLVKRAKIEGFIVLDYYLWLEVLASGGLESIPIGTKACQMLS